MKATLGQKIRELRIKKRLTQSDLSAGLVTPSMISQIESDKANPSHNLLWAIADKLETPIEHFLTDLESQMEKMCASKIASALIGKGDYEKAVTILEKLRDSNTLHVSNLEILSELATCYMRLGKHENAYELFEHVLDHAMIQKDTYQLLTTYNRFGLLAYQQKNFPIALHYWKKAYDITEGEDPVEPYFKGEICTNLGRVHAQIGEWDESISFYNKATSFLTRTPHIRSIADAYLEQAEIFRKLGEYERASDLAHSAAALYKGLKTLRSSIDVQVDYALSLGEVGRAEEGILFLERCEEQYTTLGYGDQLGELHSSLSRVLFQAGQFEKAAQYCQKALDVVRGDDLETAHIYRMLSSIYAGKNDLDTALQWVNKAVMIFEKEGQAADRVKAYQVMGDIYKRQGLYREAMECLEKMNQAMEESLRERKIMV